MPLDPSISLNVQPPQMTGGGLSTIGEFAKVQNWLNTSRMFQQTFAARQRAGEIMASSDPNDPNAIMKGLMGDPLVAPFAPQIINSIREGENTLLDMQGKQLGQSQSAFQSFLKSMPGAMADPTMLPGLIKANLAQLPPGARVTPQVREAMGDIVTSLMDGLPQGDQGGQLFRQRLAGLSMSAGVTPDVIRGVTGTMAPGVDYQPVGSGGAIVPVTRGGPVAGGAANVPLSIGGGAPTSVGGTSVPSSAGSGSLGLPSPDADAVNTLKGYGVAPPRPTQQNAPGSGLSLQQQKYIDQRTGKMGDYEAKLDTDVNTANIFAKNMQEMADMAKQATLGGGAETYKNLGQALQALGVSNETVDKWANGSLAASQVVDKVALDNVMLRAKQMLEGIGGSRFNMQEFVQLLQKNPNVTTDPRAIQAIFGLWNQYNQRYSAEQQALSSYKRLGGDIGDWPAQWQKSQYMKDFAPSTINVEGMRGTAGAPVTSSQSSSTPAQYRSADDVAAAYKAGTLSRDAAAKILRDQFGAR